MNTWNTRTRAVYLLPGRLFSFRALSYLSTDSNITASRSKHCSVRRNDTLGKVNSVRKMRLLLHQQYYST